jgi:hypothetical protein
MCWILRRPSRRELNTENAPNNCKRNNSQRCEREHGVQEIRFLLGFDLLIMEFNTQKTKNSILDLVRPLLKSIHRCLQFEKVVENSLPRIIFRFLSHKAVAASSIPSHT